MRKARASVPPPTTMEGDGYGTYRPEHQPVTWVRGYPLYAAHFIVAVYVVSMIVTALLMAGPARFGGVLTWLPFTAAEVHAGQVWRIFTYGLVNVPSVFPFVIDMLMMVWFGREVEKTYGRKKFFMLYGGIYLLPPLVLTALGPRLPGGMTGEFGALAIFVAFATIYPNVPMMFNVLAKWAAIILVGVYTLMALSANAWSWLIAICLANGFAYLFVRYERGDIELPKFRFPRRKPKLRVLPDLKPESPPAKRAAGETSMAEVDALLDKIATSGMASLTPKERAKLNAAREGLMKREPGRR
jgi:membrane associated rhomboid family serine protease